MERYQRGRLETRSLEAGLLAENVDHSVDDGDASVDVDHTVELGGDLPVRRVEPVPWRSRCRRSPSDTFSYCS